MAEKEEKLKYPKSVFFIVANEFCERFSYYGMRVVLTLYLATYLQFDESISTIIFHIFISLCYFLPLPGAIIADSWWGKYKTILYLSIVYIAGNLVLSLGSVEQLHLPQTIFTILGLLLIAIGTGGIKPCVSAFGGDQFILPQQAKQFASFFSVFYFSINAGSLLSTTLTPILREISCSSNNSCYPLAFGVPAVLLAIALVIFVCGKRWYIIKPPQENMMVKVASCVKHAISNKRKSSGQDKRSHWLDYADDKFERSFIEDIKDVLRVLVLYVPFPLFWSLYDQQGSTWTFQATRMDGWTPVYTIKPDQFQAINTILILACIPLFDKLIYPALGRCGILKKSLQRLTTGGILAGIAFLISGFLELHLEKTYPVLLESGQVNFNVINTLPCGLDIKIENPSDSKWGKRIFLESNHNFIYERLPVKTYKLKVELLGNATMFNCKAFHESFVKSSLVETMDIKTLDEKANSFMIVFNQTAKRMSLVKSETEDILEKAKGGDCHIGIIYDHESMEPKWKNISIILKARDGSIDPYKFSVDMHKSSSIEPIVKPNRYLATMTYVLNGTKDSYEIKLGEIDVYAGGNYVLGLSRNESNIAGSVKHNRPYSLTVSVITSPNSVHMLWLLPQYTIITVAEILFSITGLEFSYTQAPQSMKSVVSAAWLLTVGVGNIIVVISHTAHFFSRVSLNLFLFATLMFVDMGIFAIMAYFYVPKVTDEDDTTGNDQDAIERPSLSPLPLESVSTPETSTELEKDKNVDDGIQNKGYNEQEIF